MRYVPCQTRSNFTAKRRAIACFVLLWIVIPGIMALIAIKRILTNRNGLRAGWQSAASFWRFENEQNKNLHRGAMMCWNNVIEVE